MLRGREVRLKFLAASIIRVRFRPEKGVSDVWAIEVHNLIVVLETMRWMEGREG